MIDGDRVVHEVRYGHPVQAVWHALTDPAELAAWLMPTDFAPEPGRRFRLSWRCVAGHEPWQDSTFRFEIVAPDGGGAKLRFWQEYAVELADDYYGVYNFNWGYYLESLRLLCVTGTGKPFPATS